MSSISLTDWTKCFICQKSQREANREGVRSTTEGLNGIGNAMDILIGRNEVDAVLSRLQKCMLEKNITGLLHENAACYHHTCTLSYKKKANNESGNSSKSPNEVTPRCSKRKSSSNNLGELRCLFCSKDLH